MSKFNELVTKLREVFQIDRPELDFGVYRILNARADEINEYLEKRLKEKVEQALASGSAANIGQLKDDLKKAEQAATDAGFDPAESPKVKELKAKITQASSGNAEHENAVFSHLLTFFSRYYDNGDFISQRRYKGDTYAIPYAGEEVMLHWANKDQYYIKSGENFSNYSFKLDDGRVVHFRLVAADTAKDNRKDNDKERRFVLAEQKIITRIDDEGEGYEEEILPVQEVIKKDIDGNETKELIIRFEYKAMPKGSKQDKLVEAAVSAVLAEGATASRWLDLSKREPTEKNPKRTLLEKHLTNYTTKNTADYFIHKNLGKFLRGELDFYIKNEVIHLDDVQNAEIFSDIENNLRMIQCLRSIALDLIKFLAQLEDFQKKLWTKKKFITNTNYLISLDLVPKIVWPEVCSNKAQIQDWIINFSIDKINGFSLPITEKFLGENQELILDTKFFSPHFKNRLISNFEGLDEYLAAELYSGDNLHALSIIQEKYRDKIKFAYIDPPYNTGGDGFFYRDTYKHSSWLSMIHPKLQLTNSLLKENGVIYCSIDAVERASLQTALDNTFGNENKVEEVIWAQNTTKNQSPTFSTNHEYVQVYAKNIESVKKEYFMFREVKPGYKEVKELISELLPDYPTIAVVEKALSKLYKDHKAELKSQGVDPKDDPWKSLTNYNRAEYRDSKGNLVCETEAKEKKADIFVWREVDTSLPQVKEDSQKDEFRDENHPDFRFYRPLHPTTQRPCTPPKTGWRWSFERYGRQNTSFSELVEKDRIVWGENESKVPQQKSFLDEVSTNVAKSVVNDYADGEKELRNLFGKSRAFSNPKPTSLIERFATQADLSDSDIAIDYFAGSGTTGDAIISLNKKKAKKTKFLLVEMGEYFSSILLPRIKKSAYSLLWDDGLPVRLSSALDISRLEKQLHTERDVVQQRKIAQKIEAAKGKCDDDIASRNFITKYISLESYEDTLNNLELKKPKVDLFDNNPELKDDYLLNYMFDVESRGSLLSTDNFKKPFDYTMKIAVDSAGAFEEQKIDLVETFNYLIGLTIKHIDAQPERGFVTVTGTLPSGETCLVLWRDCEKIDYEGLNKLCDKLALNPADNEFDVVYINGDHNIPTVLSQTADEGGETRVLKLRQIEPEFLERMFAEEEI
jgi:adenine-specific DNA-methyltransferase